MIICHLSCFDNPSYDNEKVVKQLLFKKKRIKLNFEM